MQINFMRLPADEAERICYAEGFENAALLFARIEALQHAAQVLTTALDLYAPKALGDEIDAALVSLRELLP